MKINGVDDDTPPRVPQWVYRLGQTLALIGLLAWTVATIIGLMRGAGASWVETIAVCILPVGGMLGLLAWFAGRRLER